MMSAISVRRLRTYTIPAQSAAFCCSAFSINSRNHLETKEKNGAPGVIRTPDLLIRSQSLYPAELRARWVGLTGSLSSLRQGVNTRSPLLVRLVSPNRCAGDKASLPGKFSGNRAIASGV